MRAPNKNLPNILSFIRLLMVPLFIWLFFSGAPLWAAGIVFLVAGITDILDGHIARKYNQVSDFGKFLDPLADKLLTIACMCMMCEWGMMPAWALMIVLTREFAVTGLRLVAVQNGTVIAAGWSGKVKTASTMVGLCFVMAFPAVGWLVSVVNWMIVITTLYSGIEYFVQNWKCLGLSK